MAWSNNSAWGANYQLADVANMLVQIFSPNCANFGILTRSTYTTTILLNTGDLLCTLLCTLVIIFIVYNILFTICTLLKLYTIGHVAGSGKYRFKTSQLSTKKT